MSAGDVEDIYELSPLQQGILFHSLYTGDSDLYVNQRSFLLEGPLDADVLQRAWDLTTDAHTALRTSFHWDGLDKPLQVVHRRVPTTIARYDWADQPDAEERFRRLVREDLAAGFDVAQPPLQRLHLARLGPDRHGFVWTHHLLMLDGWSVPVFLNDVMRRYRMLTLGGPEPLSAPPYRDYIAWLQQQDLDAARTFWVEAFAGRTAAQPPAPMLDPARGALPTVTLQELVVDVPPALESALHACAARHRVTMNTVLQGAWALVLERWTGGSEVTFGVTSSCRPPQVAGVERMTGLFTNTLPVAVSVPASGDVGTWLRRLQADYTGVRRYEYTPLPQIKQWIGMPGTEPLFHSLVVVDNYSLAVDLGGLDRLVSIRPLDAVEKTSQPLVVIATPEPTFTLRVRYHAERFSPGGAEGILASFRAAVEALTVSDRVEAAAVATAAADPPASAGPGPQRGPARRAEGHAVREPDVRHPDARYPDVRYADVECTLADLVERQCRATPRAVAVVGEDGRLRYQELLERARRVAAALQAEGLGHGDVVGVCAERSLDLVVALVGTVLAGGAYLPLEPSSPPARLAAHLEDSGATMVLADVAGEPVVRGAGATRVLALQDVQRRSALQDRRQAEPARTRPDDPAYVIFTSGSTGRPKGVVVTHRAIVNRLLWMQDTFALGAEERVLQKTPFSFDVSVWEFFWPLLVGATVVVAAPGGHQDPAYLARTIARRGVGTAHFVPSMLRLFLDEPGVGQVVGSALRRIVCSGEALPPDLARRCGEVLPGVELHNLYGPTEAAVDVTWWDCARPGPDGVMPIGHPVANVRTAVLDRRLMPVPSGTPGELYLAGVQLAQGYSRRHALTASRFVAHPMAGPGGRLYRTGDQVRVLPDGALEFLGRLDHQVKIHGYRIELGEIEAVLADHPLVRDAAVVVRDGGGQLDAFVAPARLPSAEAGDIDEDEPQPDAEPLREHLRARLPRWMVPATITWLPALPLTHNGKVDRAALRQLQPRVSAAGEARKAVAPATPREAALAAAFGEVLGLAVVDVTASFFDLGGTSYDAVRAVRGIDGATVGLLGAFPTVRALATELDRADDARRILLRLTPADSDAHTVVCVPFGGGSAISYQPLAAALPTGTALVSLSLPGHELGGDDTLRPLEEVAADAAEAVLRTVEGPLSVYGHCAGVGLAVELVRRLEEAGRPVDRLYLGGSYPFYAPGAVGGVYRRVASALIRSGVLRVSAATVGLSGADPRADRAELRYLQSLGGFAEVVDDAELAFVLRAFRHDVDTTGQYFTSRWHPRRGAEKLETPITFLAGDRDPLTRAPLRRGVKWRRVGRQVEIVTIADGGHYFHQEHPEQVAQVVADRLPVTSPAGR